MRDHPLDWVKSLPSDFHDAGSFRHMRRFALEELNENMRIRAEIVAKNGEQVAVEEWDSTFEADNERCREAVRLIDEHLPHYGLTTWA